MDDLISRQAAIDAFIEWYGGEPSDIDYFKELLDESPSAQPEPSQVARDIAAIIENEQDMRVILKAAQKKGHWIEDGYTHYKAVCSECGEPCATYAMDKPRDRFCKWCGADMRGEQDE